MENLILCSRTLYDHDISKKMNEISELKKEIRSLKKPKKFYESWEEFEKKKVEAFSIIRKSVDEVVSDNDFEWSYMETLGVTPRQCDDIPESISDALTLLTENTAWSDTTAFDVVWPVVESFVGGLMENGGNLWNILYSHSSSEEIGDLFFDIIEKYINENLLQEDVFMFKCVKCNKVDDYVDENNRCIDCENIV
jgi:hypothetical protein